MSKPLRVVYAGTPDFAVPALQALIDSPHEVVAVYTQPDRPAGRGRKLRASPVKQLALEHDIPVEQPPSLRDEEAQAQLASYDADVMVVAAYGLILPQAVLDTPKHGCLNIHGSILPRWRGAAPIHRAILAGDEETGITIMQMNAGLDTGDMLLIKSLPIGPADTTAILHDQLAALGASALIETLELLTESKLDPQVQDDSLSTYADKLAKEEGIIDWNESAEAIARRIRAFNPWPVAQTAHGDKMLRLWMAEALDQAASGEPGKVIGESKQGIDVACGEGTLRITQLQLPGGKPMNIPAFLNGRTLLNEQLG
jgi:methionyl-tRNA formyltransferase